MINPNIPNYSCTPDEVFHDFLRTILSFGNEKADRTGVGTISHHGYLGRYRSVDAFFPLLTTKKMYFNAIKVELIWLLRGMTNIKWLNDNNCTIWDEWADENGDLGPVYGAQWRRWSGFTHIDSVEVVSTEDGIAKDMRASKNFRLVDQLADVFHSVLRNPMSRRHIVTAWNPANISDMALPPCHKDFIFMCTEVESDVFRVDIRFSMRSNDAFLGAPFNIASYAIMLMMFVHCWNKHPARHGKRFLVGDTLHHVDDAHIYTNHLDAVKLQLGNDPRKYNSPTVKLIDRKEISMPWDFEPSDIVLEGYESYPSIKAEVAV